MTKTIKQIIFCAIFLGGFLAGQDVQAACTGVSPTWTTTPDYTSMNDCVTNVTQGDTIYVSAGTVDWLTDILTVKKSFTLIGAGIGNTNITCSGAYCIKFDMYNYNDALSRSGDIPFKVIGFSFTGGGIYLGEAGSEKVPFTNISIGKNSFTNVSDSVLYMLGHFWGVAYENTFNNCRSMSFMGNQRTSWDTFGAMEFGSENNFYIENNTFTNTTNFYLNSGHGSRYIIRYNTFSDSFTFDSPMWDQHGVQPGLMYSLMGAEIYGNIYNVTSSRYWWEYLRGGKLMLFNNYMTAGSGSTQVTQIQYNYDEAISPVDNATISVQKPNNVYAWNNHINGVNQVWNNATDYEIYPDMIGKELVDSVDYFSYNVACTKNACSSGIGTGSDTPTGTCTTGVGYWKTSYFTPATPPTTMADMITYSQAGTFYKCTSTDNWESYYTPYTYPHPLRNESAVDTTPPATPTGFIVS